MKFDLTNLTTQQAAVLAAGATLIGAMIAGIFALTVALVNGWTANWLARRNAVRAYRKELFNPYATTVNAITVLAWNWRRGITVGELQSQLDAIMAMVDSFVTINMTSMSPAPALKQSGERFMYQCGAVRHWAVQVRSSLLGYTLDEKWEGKCDTVLIAQMEEEVQKLYTLSHGIRRDLERYIFK